MVSHRNILVIDGPPDGQPRHLVHALARAYAAGATAKGHSVRWIKLAELDVPVLTSREDWETEAVPEPLRRAQDALGWAKRGA